MDLRKCVYIHCTSYSSRETQKKNIYFNFRVTIIFAGIKFRNMGTNFKIAHSEHVGKFNISRYNFS